MISIRPNENGTLKIEISFTDEEGVSHSLNSLTSVKWQLSDRAGNVINNRSFENGLITSNPVMLSGEDLAIGDSGSVRVFAVKIVYNSTNGNDLEEIEEEKFAIKDLVNVA